MRRGAGIPNSSLRLAKNQDDFDDPNGTEVDGIEFFPPGTNPPGFLLPDCPVPEEDEPVPSLHHAGSALAAAGAVADKRGGSGVTLAGRTGVASQVSAFSEWSSVAIQDEAPTATISGTTFVVEEGDVSVQGVTVDLFCNESPEPIASTTSNADGNFFFDGEVDGFEPGDDCYLEASKEVDGGALSGRNPSVSSEVFSFEVQEGENDRDIQLEPNADAEIIGNATWDNDGTQEPFPFADVALFCEGLEGLEERAAVVADEGGFYELNTIEHDFDIGDECFVEATGVPFEGVGSYSGSNPEEGTFTVEAGTAVRDIQTFNVGS